MILTYNQMDEKRFVWDNFQNRLVFLGDIEQEDKKTKRHRKKISVISKSKIYCPHADLILKFLDILNPSQKIKFRKYYLRKVLPNEPDVITIQDIKNLVMCLLITPVSLEFINFCHLQVVDRFLRALIIYFQFYTDIWEELMKKRDAIMTKAPNPLAKNSGLIQADQMRVLRCLLAREYCDLLVGCDETTKYHHLIIGTGSVSMISQGEKDLRIFEALISIAHRVVWIALHRKHFHLIEVELHRLFRSDAYSIVSKKSKETNQILLEEEMRILHGSKIPPRRKLLKNSPLIHQLFNELCDFRVVSLGLIDFQSKDPRINYLKNALLVEEEKLSELGIELGILGHPRVNYDISLAPIDDEKVMESETMEAWERRKSTLSQKSKRRKSADKQSTTMPVYGPAELPNVFPLSKVKHERKISYNKCREDARKRWISRELERQTHTYIDTVSIATSGDN